MITFVCSDEFVSPCRPSADRNSASTSSRQEHLAKNKLKFASTFIRPVMTAPTEYCNSTSYNVQSTVKFTTRIKII